MEYVYAAMLLHRAGKPISEENVNRVLQAAEINADPIRVKALVASLEEVDIDKAIESSAMFVSPPVASVPEEKPVTIEEKKEAKEEEKKEEEALEGLGALFG